MPALDAEHCLILVKHSLPAVSPFENAHQWMLSAEGQRRCEQLASGLAQHQPTRLVCSPEAKAWETAHIVARRLGLPVESVDGLHEHLRRTTPYIERYRFEKLVRAFFEQPADLIFGEETAEQALQRFEAAVQGCQQRYPQDNLVVVAHGTVISLYLQAVCRLDAFQTWQRLGMPSYVRLRLPGFDLQEFVAEIS